MFFGAMIGKKNYLSRPLKGGHVQEEQEMRHELLHMELG